MLNTVDVEQLMERERLKVLRGVQSTERDLEEGGPRWNAQCWIRGLSLTVTGAEERARCQLGMLSIQIAETQPLVVSHSSRGSFFLM